MVKDCAIHHVNRTRDHCDALLGRCRARQVDRRIARDIGPVQPRHHPGRHRLVAWDDAFEQQKAVHHVRELVKSYGDRVQFVALVQVADGASPQDARDAAAAPRWAPHP